MSKGRRFACGDALERVEPVLALLGPTARIAGSLRRGKETVRDVDVVYPAEFTEELRGALAEMGTITAAGDKKIRLVLEVPGVEFGEGEVPGLQVDVVACPPEEFGACLMYLTGPHDYNIKMRSHAKAMGLKLNEKGLWDGDRRLTGATEREVFEALDLRWTSPAGRKDLKTFSDQVVFETSVASSKKGKKPYRVQLHGDGKWTCECPGWQWSKKRPKSCRHIEKVAKPEFETQREAS